MFFEGTGQGVEGKFTNVTRLRDLLVEDDGQRVHLEAGPGTHFGAYLFGKVFGADGREILRSARRWFQQTAAEEGMSDSGIKVFLFGFRVGRFLRGTSRRGSTSFRLRWSILGCGTRLIRR